MFAKMSVMTRAGLLHYPRKPVDENKLSRKHFQLFILLVCPYFLTSSIPMILGRLHLIDSLHSENPLMKRINMLHIETSGDQSVRHYCSWY